MRMRTTVSAIALITLMAPAAFAQGAASEQGVERMAQMEQLMARAEKAKSPEERQKLMREHVALMQEQMRAMRGMMQGGMMQGSAGKQGQNPAHHKGDAKAGADGTGKHMQGGMQGMGGGMMQGGMMMHQHMQAMHKRMDMMQKMMEQIVAEQRLMMETSKSKRRK